MKTNLLILVVAFISSCTRDKEIAAPAKSFNLIGTTWCMAKNHFLITTFDFPSNFVISTKDSNEFPDSGQYLQFLNSTTVREITRINMTSDTVSGTYSISDKVITISLDSSNYWFLHQVFSLTFNVISDTILYLNFPYLTPWAYLKDKNSTCSPPIICYGGPFLGWVNLFVNDKPESLYTPIVSAFVDSLLASSGNDSVTADTVYYYKNEYFYHQINQP